MNRHPGGNMSKHPVKQIVLASRPKGLPTPENFRLEDTTMPALPNHTGQVNRQKQ
jgi:NADPH-dependent curcumin reductase CurA